MAQTKDKYYWLQLRTALTGGFWGSSTPAKAHNGSPISWLNLLRKFNKHCHGFKDVAELASQTQALALLIAGGTSDSDLDGDAQSAAGPFAMNEECTVAPGRTEEVQAGYDKLKSLESDSPNSDVRASSHSTTPTNPQRTQSLRLLLAHYAYALGRHEECLSYLEQVGDLSDAWNRLDPSSSVRTTASTLQVPSIAGDGSSSSFTGSFVSSDSASTISDIQDGKAWSAIEVIRSICLQGFYTRLKC